MKRIVKYSDEPTGKLQVIKDFLPPPEKLNLKKIDKQNKPFRDKLKGIGQLDEMRKDK